MKHIRIAIECIKESDTTLPKRFILSHYLTYLKLNNCSNVPSVTIKFENEQIIVIDRGYYVQIAKLLAHNSIRCGITAGYETLKERFNSCIIDHDVSNELELEGNKSIDRIVDLIYFNKKFDTSCFEHILINFNSFIQKNKLKLFNIQFNIEERYVIFDYEMLLMGDSQIAKDLHKIHIDWNSKYGIESLNGIKFSTYE